MRRAGFTLIEILIVVGIIVIMLATAVMSVASGRGAVQAKEATRGVIQLSRYAYALALLRQKEVVVTFFNYDRGDGSKVGKVEVRMTGEAAEAKSAPSPAAPLYREVAGIETSTIEEYGSSENDEGGSEEAHRAQSGSGSGVNKDGEKNGYFYTRRVLDPETLAKEDAEGEYEGVTFTVEVLGEDGKPLSPEEAAARSLPRPERKMKSDASLFIDGVRISDDEPDEESRESNVTPPVSITYETNGSVNPHRIIVRLNGESESSEGFVINVSSTGKVTVGDDEEEEERGSRAKRRRRR